MRILKRILLATGGVLVACLLICAVTLLIWSPGKIEPYRNSDGSVLSGSTAEIARVQIGGMEQGMILQGKDVSRPVLLFLHGGPGSPEYPMVAGADNGLDELFTVCWWDQRGAGMSYSSSIPPETMTLERLVEDTKEVAEYLFERFGVEKVYLMGHSWGSYLGVYAAAKYPELFHAYIGIGQIGNQFASEKQAYAYMLDQAMATGDSGLEKALLKFSLDTPESLTPEYMSVRTQGMNKLGIGLSHKKASMLWDAVLPVLQSPVYTLPQKIGYVRGMTLAQEYLWDGVSVDDLSQSVPSLEMPVFILQGAHDYQTSYREAKAYFDSLEAPEKSFYTFTESAHSPLIEEPGEFERILREDVLGAREE